MLQSCCNSGTLWRSWRATVALRGVLLALMAGHLSSLTNQFMVQHAAAELPAIAQARAYIKLHQAEVISLGEVARAVNMSDFYFCKSFRKATGLTFTDHLARLAAPIWQAQHAHPFVQGIGDGTLDVARFAFWIRQDYLFLIEYCRLFGLAVPRNIGSPREQTPRHIGELSAHEIVVLRRRGGTRG